MPSPERLEKLFSTFKKDQNDKDSKINGLDIMLDVVEKEHQNQKKQNEKKIKEKTTSKDRVSQQKTSVEGIHCSMCDFTTTSKQGLKIHNSKVHSKIDFASFPAACDVCEKVLTDENELKEHKKREHISHTVKYQCNECPSMANEPQTLQVHFGRVHSATKNCGLCDKDFDNSKELEKHLTECEIFVCDNSGCKKTFLTQSEIREHILEEHKKNGPEHYSWFYWEYNSKDKSEFEVSKKYTRIWPKDW